MEQGSVEESKAPSDHIHREGPAGGRRTGGIGRGVLRKRRKYLSITKPTAIVPEYGGTDSGPVF